jgi:hypothetical protein
MKKVLLLAIALLAAYLAVRAVKRNAETITLLCVLIGLSATASTANSPKTRAVEDRLNTLVPQVFPNTGGTVNGSMTVTGNHTAANVIAQNQVLVNGASSSARLAVLGDAHITSTLAADGGLSTGGNLSASGSASLGSVATNSVNSSGQVLVNGASSGAAFAVNGDAHITSTATIDGGVSTGSAVNARQLTANASGGQDLEVGSGGGHIGGSLQVDGNMVFHTMNGQGLPQGTIGNPTTAVASLQSCCIGLINRLQAVGLIS